MSVMLLASLLSLVLFVDPIKMKAEKEEEEKGGEEKREVPAELA